MTDRFSSAYVSPIFIQRWHTSPKLSDVQDVVDVVEGWHKKEKKLSHAIVLVGEDIPLPDREGREALKLIMDGVKPFVHCMQLVFEGNSTKATMQRTIVDALQMFGRLLTKGMTRVHATGDSAVKTIAVELGLPADYFLVQARKTKLI